jgi:hypothetical protein
MKKRRKKKGKKEKGERKKGMRVDAIILKYCRFIVL